MFFNKKYLTTAGKNLLDQAVAGSTIIWSTCATSSLSYVDDATARELTDIAVDGKYTSFGEVEEVTPSNNGNLTITCRVTNNPDTISGTVSGEARAFGVWARLENSDISTLVVVAFWDLNEGSPETVPDQSQSPFEATVDLYIKTSDNVISTIQSNPSWMTPLDTFNRFKDEVAADLNDLKDRVVTTHSAGNESTGDNQTVKGEKTFDGYATFEGGVFLDSTVSCDGDLYVNGEFGAYGDAEINNLRVYDISGLSDSSIKTNSSIEPNNTNIALGSKSKPFNSIYAHTLNGCLPTNIPTSSTSSDYFPRGSIFLAIIEVIAEDSSPINVSSGYFLDLTSAQHYDNRVVDIYEAVSCQPDNQNAVVTGFKKGRNLTDLRLGFRLLCGLEGTNWMTDSPYFLTLVMVA